MRTQWFADPADGERLDETLLRLVGAASRMLDGLVRPPVAQLAGPAPPQALVPGLLVAQLVLGGFAGTALLAVAARPWVSTQVGGVHGELRCGVDATIVRAHQHAARARTWWPLCCCGCRTSPPDMPEPGR